MTSVYMKDLKRRAELFVVVNMLAHDMLQAIPADQRGIWLEKLRGIDTRRRLLYDCGQVRQTDNRTIPELSGTSNRPQGQLSTTKEKAMGGEEE